MNFRFQGGKHYRISLDKHARKHLSKVDAQTLANDLRSAIQKGEYPPTITAPAVATTTADVTFAELGTKWLERERQDRVGDWKSDRSRLARLGRLLVDEAPVANRAIGRITADDLEMTFRQLEVDGASGSSLNKYLQTFQHLQRWGVRRSESRRA